MKKRAVIEVSLVPESADTLNSQIEKEIRKEAKSEGEIKSVKKLKKRLKKEGWTAEAERI